MGKPKTQDNLPPQKFQTGKQGEAPSKVFTDYDWVILDSQTYTWVEK